MKSSSLQLNASLRQRKGQCAKTGKSWRHDGVLRHKYLQIKQ